MPREYATGKERDVSSGLRKRELVEGAYTNVPSLRDEYPDEKD